MKSSLASDVPERLMKHCLMRGPASGALPEAQLGSTQRGSAQCERELLERLANDPAIDRRHDVEALGRRNEGRWRNAVALPVDHGHQDLDALRLGLARQRVDDRLVAQLEAVLLESRADAADELHLGLAFGDLVIAGV